MRSGLIVFFTLLAISGFLGWRQYQLMKTELVPTQDLVIALLYYIEQTEGQFPESAADLVDAGIFQREPDGAYVVVPPEDTAYRQSVHGYPLRDLNRFQVRWGTDLSMLYIDNQAKVRDIESDDEVILVRWPRSKPSGATYSSILVDAYRRSREAVAPEQPASATQPAAAPAED